MEKKTISEVEYVITKEELAKKLGIKGKIIYIYQHSYNDNVDIKVRED